MNLLDIAKKAMNVVEIKNETTEWAYRFPMGGVMVTLSVTARVYFYMNHPDPMVSFHYRLTAGESDTAIMFGDVIKSNGPASNWEAVFGALAELRSRAHDMRATQTDILYEAIREAVER